MCGITICNGILHFIITQQYHSSSCPCAVNLHLMWSLSYVGIYLGYCPASGSVDRVMCHHCLSRLLQCLPPLSKYFYLLCQQSFLSIWHLICHSISLSYFLLPWPEFIITAGICFLLLLCTGFWLYAADNWLLFLFTWGAGYFLFSFTICFVNECIQHIKFFLSIQCGTCSY